MDVMLERRRSSAPPLRAVRLLLPATAFALLAASGGAQAALAGSAFTPVAATTVSVPTEPLPPPPEGPVVTSEPAGPPATASVAPSAARSARTAAGSFHDGDGEVDQVPLSALAAYQRTEVVMADAMRSCHLDWTVLAAVGQVLTDHGRQDGDHTIDDEGRVSPAIVGVPIRDVSGRRLADSDGGALDGRRGHDRAVGPMLLAPAAWRDIGVDGDADGARDPQDIDDAALAAAVLLCVDGNDLRRPRQLSAALEDLNDADDFVTTVPELAEAYANDVTTFEAVPVYAGPAVTYPSPAPTAVAHTGTTEHKGSSTQSQESRAEASGSGKAGKSSSNNKPNKHKSGSSDEPKKGQSDASKPGNNKTGSKGGSQDGTQAGGTQEAESHPEPEPTEGPAEGDGTDQDATPEPATPVEPTEEPAAEPAPAPAPEPEPAPEPAEQPAEEPEREAAEAPAPKEAAPAPTGKPDCGADGGAGGDAADGAEDPSCPGSPDPAESTEP